MESLRRISMGLLLVLSVVGCSDYAPSPNSTATPFVARYDPAAGAIPFPNDLVYDAQTNRLALPIDPARFDPNDPYANPAAAANTLSGFSTTAAITASFSEPIDAQSLLDPYAVVVLELAPDPYTKFKPARKLQKGVDYELAISPADPKTLVIQPILPLKPATTYLVAITDRIRAASGASATPDLFFRYLKGNQPLVDAYGQSQMPASNADAQRLEPLRQLLVQVFKPMLAGYGISWGGATSGVVAAWLFHTQPIGQVLARIVQDSFVNPYANPAHVFVAPTAPSPATNGLGVLDPYQFVLAFDPYGTKGLTDLYSLGGLQGIGSIAIGAVDLPYYLAAAQNAQDPAPLASTFQLDAYGMPAMRSLQRVPFLLTIPQGAAPAGGWPVVIFQHGFGRSKTDLLAVARSLANAGFAAIAIDAPLHGDRTFGLDFVTEDAYGNLIANVPDGKPDSSGRHFLNLGHLLTSRDNLRQAAADLIHLARLIERQAIDVASNATGAPGADGTPDLAQSVAGIVGHSLGAMLATIVAAVDPYVQAAVLANPGGGIATILSTSPTFKPLIDAGLQQAAGIQPGSVDYYKFLMLAQTIVDDADPLNYAPVLAASANDRVFLLRTEGDQVVPNPTTDRLSLAMGLPLVVYDPGAPATDPYTNHAWWPLGTQPSGLPGSGFANYKAGGHGSFLKPAVPTNPRDLDLLAAMEGAGAWFLATANQGAAQIKLDAAGDPLPKGTALADLVE